LLGGFLRVNLQSRKPRNCCHRANGVTDSLIEYLADIRGRIGTDQQNPLTLFSQTDSRRAGNRRFSYASLTGKKTDKVGYSVRISYVLLTYSATGSITTTTAGGS